MLLSILTDYPIHAIDGNIIVSFDGVTDHEFVRTGETLQIRAREPQTSNRSNFAKGTKIYARGGFQLKGDIYLSGYYQLTF